MSNVLAILRRELSGTFGHPLAYIALTLFALMLAVLALWLDDVLARPVASMRVPFFWTSVCLLFLVPAVTMRLLAEERRTGSLELLSTLPVTPRQIVVGKWLAAVVLVGVALLLTGGYPLALATLGDLDWGPVVGGYLGLFLFGATLAAIGTATSALTESQVIAFLVALVVGLIPWLVGLALPLVPADLVPLVQYLTFEYHFANLARGVLDSRSLVFFAGVIAVGLELAATVLDHRRLS